MDPNIPKRRSIYENVELVAEKSTKRTSLFEIMNESSLIKKETESKLEEWNQRWGKHGTDFVNVVNYPPHCVDNVKEELRMWGAGLDELIEKANKFILHKQYVNAVDECDLTPEQKRSLEVIDSQIQKFINEVKTSLQLCQVLEGMHSLRMSEIDREIKLMEKLISSKINSVK